MPNDPTTNLYYEVAGEQNAKSIVFLHGGGAGGWMWREQVKALAPDYHVLTPDMPGQGMNTHNGTGPFTTLSAADTIAEFIRSQAHEGQAHVVGLSEGGQVLVGLLSRRPEVVDHAIVSSAKLRPMWSDKISSPRMARMMYRWFMAPFKNNDWWIRQNMRSSAGIPDQFFPEFKKSFQETTEDSLLQMLDSGLHFRLPAGLERATAPVLVAVGNKEYKEMRLSALLLLAALPNARGVLVSLGPKSSLAKEHNWAMTAPDLFNATVKAWIEDRPLPDNLQPLVRMRMNPDQCG